MKTELSLWLFIFYATAYVLAGYSAGKTNRPGPVYSLIESGILRFYRYGLHKGIDYL